MYNTYHLWQDFGGNADSDTMEADDNDGSEAFDPNFAISFTNHNDTSS